MSGCKPEEGLFPPDGNTLTFDQDDMRIELSCQPGPNNRCTAKFSFMIAGKVEIPYKVSTLAGQPCTKLGLAQAWELFRDELLMWSATQDSTVADKAHRLMAKTMSEFLRRDVDLGV